MSVMTIPVFFGGMPHDADAPRRVSTRAAAARWVVVRGDDDAPAPNAVDAALLSRLRQADEQAFRDIWETYHERLATFALRYLHSRDAAADVVQDVFIALWERHEHIEVRGSIASYLYSMVRYTAMDLLKHEGVVQRHAALMAAEYAAAPVVASNLGASVAEVEALQEIIRRVVTGLAPRTREIFLMSREDGLAPAAIANVLGIAPQVVYNQLTRALKALHAAIDDVA